MTAYEQKAFAEMQRWRRKMMKKPGYFNRLSKKWQRKLNSYIPEKLHNIITQTIKQMVRAVIFGAKYTVPKKIDAAMDLQMRELLVEERIKFYRTTAAAEGAVTGAGGLWLGLADFPLLLSLKLKLLFDIATYYGYNVKDYKERIFILHILELAFSSQEHRNDVYQRIQNWDMDAAALPESADGFDWRSFQQEYRDYLDLAKLAQLIPVIGAPVGVVVNYRLVRQLGHTAMNAYRMRQWQLAQLSAPRQMTFS